MKYLLDSNTFIEAKNDYYRFSFCPGYWDWIKQKNQEKIIYSVDKIKSELLRGNDDLTNWVKNVQSGIFLKPSSPLSSSLVIIAQWVDSQKYTIPAKNVFFASADYYLIVYAHAFKYTVVTRERSDPNSKKRVKIPDVCAGVNVPYINPFQLLENENAKFICS